MTLARGMVLAVAIVVAVHTAIAVGQELDQRRLSQRSVGELLAAAGVQGPGLYVVIQAEDCPGDGTFLVRWRALHGAEETLVYGILVGERGLAEAERRWGDALGSAALLRPIPERHAAHIGARLGHTRTPFAIVLDERGAVSTSFLLESLPAEPQDAAGIEPAADASVLDRES